MRHAAWTVIVAAALGGCVQGPHVPKDGSPDAYSWRAPIGIEGSEPVYRFDIDIGPDVQQGLAEEDIRSLAVFDAHGTPQACGAFGNGPIESTVTLSHARISAFASDMCASYGSPAVCFKGHDCAVPDICPRTRIDLTRSTALAGIDALPDLLAIANTPPDACDLDRSSPCREVGFDDAIHTKQRLTRRDARIALHWAHLDELLTPDPLPPPRQTAGSFNPGSGEVAGAGGSIRGRLGGAMLSGPGSSAGRVDRPIPLTPPGRSADRSANSNAAAPDDSGYVVEFDEPATEIRLYWSPPTGGQIGTTTLAAYDAEGHRHEHTDPLQPFGGNLADRFEQVVWLDLHPKALRVTARSSLPDLRLVAATSTKREHKPFVDTHLRQYWFAAEGTAPYALYFERGHGTCGYNEDSRRLATYPRLNDPDWPPAAKVGAPLRNSRGVLTAMATSQFGVLVWLAWLGLMCGLWLVGAALVGARWWVLRSTRPQRRS